MTAHMPHPNEKEIVKRNITQIASMEADQIQKRRAAISTSNISKMGKEFLYRACDMRMEEIAARQDLLEVTNGDTDDIIEGAS
jgi:hypothetical protein